VKHKTEADAATFFQTKIGHASMRDAAMRIMENAAFQKR
jgi:hypothetical protein